MASTFDICIRGAGIVGRTLALHLAGQQLRVALVAKAPAAAAAPDVRAYALNLRSRALIEAVRCWPDEADATPVLAMEVLDHAQGRVRFSAVDQGLAALNWIVDVPALERRLHEAVRFHPLIEVVDEACNATLTVVCEGRTSAAREEFGVEWDVNPYGQTALATRVRSALPHGQVARQWFEQADILALLPLGGPHAHSSAVVWSLSPQRAEALANACEDEFAQSLLEASRGALGALSLESPRCVWTLQQAQVRRWVGTGPRGAWALAGDAAHNMHPLAGQGLNEGLVDVAELVRVLAERPYWRRLDDQRLLRQYERSRRADFAVSGTLNDALQQLFTQTHPVVQTVRQWGMNRFDASGLLKQWATERAMGRSTTPMRTLRTTP